MARAFLVSFSLLLVTVSAAAQRQRWTEPPPLKHGTWKQDTFQSEAVGQKVRYGIYLPPGYDKPENKDKKYPLALWLHGMHEDGNRFNIRGGSAVLDEMVAKGEVPELILVSPNGGNSFYVNGKESGKWEDMIVKDLIPYLEKTYRILEGRAHRAMMGVSMGGMGALKIALRHPELFSVVAAHSAAIFPPDPENLTPRFKRVLDSPMAAAMGLDQIFGDPFDKKIWQDNNPLYLVEHLDPEKLQGMRIYFDCGTEDRYNFDEPNQELDKAMTAKKIPHTFQLIQGGGHGWGSGYNEHALPSSLRFVAATWAATEGKKGLESMLQPGSASSSGKESASSSKDKQNK